MTSMKHGTKGFLISDIVQKCRLGDYVSLLTMYIYKICTIFYGRVIYFKHKTYATVMIVNELMTVFGITQTKNSTDCF